MSLVLLGILNSQAAGAGAASAMELIDEQVLSSATTTVTFSGLNSYYADYENLHFRLLVRGTNAANYSTMLMRVNGVTNSYAYSYFRTTGSTPSYSASTSSSEWFFEYHSGGADTAGRFSPIILDVADWSDGAKYSMINGWQGRVGVNRQVMQYQGHWFSSPSWTSVSFTENTSSFAQYSRFSIYGTKKA